MREREIERKERERIESYGAWNERFFFTRKKDSFFSPARERVNPKIWDERVNSK